MRKYIVVALLSCIPMHAFTQAIDGMKPHELAFDPVSLLRAGQTINVLYKKHNMEKKTATRFKANANFSFDHVYPLYNTGIAPNNPPPKNLVEINQNSAALSLSYGREKQFVGEGRFGVYRFYDVGLSVDQSHYGQSYASYSYVNGTPSRLDNFIITRNKTMGSSINADIGLGARYMLNSHFSLFVEMSVYSYVSAYKIAMNTKSYAYQSFSNSFTQTNDISTKSPINLDASLNLHPTAQLYFSYRW